MGSAQAKEQFITIKKNEQTGFDHVISMKTCREYIRANRNHIFTSRKLERHFRKGEILPWNKENRKEVY